MKHVSGIFARKQRSSKMGIKRQSEDTNIDLGLYLETGIVVVGRIKKLSFRLEREQRIQLGDTMHMCSAP